LVTGGRFFPFLPPHGRRLDYLEEYPVFGDFVTAVMKGVDRSSSIVHMRDFERAVEQGDLLLVKTPAPILQDSVSGATKMLTLTSGTLGSADPCWDNEDESITDFEPR